ncbi:MAG: AarF/ABC1/UbiB kinase family protein [Bdellovibrionota bacterium]
MNKKDNKIPIHPFSRGTVVAKSLGKAGISYATGYAKSLISGEEAKLAAQEKSANQIFQGLGQLKGLALKFAQLLSMEKDLLPPAFQKAFANAHYKAPGLNRALVRKVIQNGFGENPEDIFSQFDLAPTAAASLGQVHAATLPGGEKVAVKIQYPGIDQSIEKDLQVIRTLVLPRMKDLIVLQLFDELEEKTKEELDYELEQKNTKEFYDTLHFPSIKIPKVYPDYCRGHVLTTEYFDGKHLNEFLASSPSQEMIDLIAQRLYNLVMYCCFSLGKFHADPNPGNYMFWEDGKIGILDFGCIKEFEHEQGSLMINMWEAVASKDQEKISEAYTNFGFNNSTFSNREEFKAYFEKHYESMIKPFDDWMLEPLRDEYFDLKKHHQFCDRGSALFRKAMVNPDFKIFNSSFMYFDRTWMGLFRILEKMGAKIKVRNPADFQSKEILKEIENEM